MVLVGVGVSSKTGFNEQADRKSVARVGSISLLGIV